MADTSRWLVPGIVGTVLGAVITGWFNYVSHQGDIDAKMIELSVGILRAEPTPETAPLREWAIDVIDKRAGFKFNTAQRAALLKKELPFKGGWSPGFSEGFGPSSMPYPPQSNAVGGSSNAVGPSNAARENTP
jgi:hypothetical protein